MPSPLLRPGLGDNGCFYLVPLVLVELEIGVLERVPF